MRRIKIICIFFTLFLAFQYFLFSNSVDAQLGMKTYFVTPFDHVFSEYGFVFYMLSFIIWIFVISKEIDKLSEELIYEGN